MSARSGSFTPRKRPGSRARACRRGVQKSMWERRGGLTDMDYMKIEEFGDMVTQMLFQMQRNIENPIVRFRNFVGKIAYITSLALKLCFLVGAAVGVGLITDVVARRWFEREINWSAWLERATTFGWVQLLLLGALLVVIRRIILRLNQ